MWCPVACVVVRLTRGCRVTSVTNQADGDVSGVVVADTHGLCIAAKGVGSAPVAAFSTAIMSRASALSDTGELPIISIETDARYVSACHACTPPLLTSRVAAMS